MNLDPSSLLIASVATGFGFYFPYEIEKESINFLRQLEELNIRHFGVFVTVRRSEHLEEEPYDIHGCVGYIQPQFDSLPVHVLYDKIISLSYQSSIQDSRSRFFTEPLYRDSSSVFEISLLKLPLFLTDKKTGISELGEFNNETMGLLLVENNENPYQLPIIETFLPGVYSDMAKWKRITKSLSEKANIKRKYVDFYTYITDTFKGTVFMTIFTSPYIIKCCFIPFYRKMIDYYQDFFIINNSNNINYSSLEQKNKKYFIFNDLTTLSFLKKISNYFENAKFIWNDIVEYYQNDFIKNNNNNVTNGNTNQNILPLLFLLSNDRDFRINILSTLVKISNELNIIDELKLYLSIIPEYINYVSTRVDFILEKSFNQLETTSNQILLLNLLAQFIVIWKQEKYDSYIDIIRNKLNKEAELLLQQQNPRVIDLALCFEGLSAVYKYGSDSKNVQDMIIYEYYNNVIFELYYKLSFYFDKKIILYRLEDGTESTGITTHILNGLLYFTGIQ